MQLNTARDRKLHFWTGCDFAKSILLVALPDLGRASSFGTEAFDLASSRRVQKRNLQSRTVYEREYHGSEKTHIAH